MDKTVNPAEKIRGTVYPPSDKSISQRSVMFASLHEGMSEIRNYSSAADPRTTIDCFRKLGVTIMEDGDTLTVRGVGRDGLQKPQDEIDCGNSGTTMRLLSGILAGAGIPAVLVGDQSLSHRTMRRIIDPLEMMGATIEARKGDYAPLKISRDSELRPIRFELPIPSAQLKSTVLLAGLFGEEPTRVVEKITSRDHTERLLQLPLIQDNDMKIISSSRNDEIPGQSYRIPGDYSSAAFWLVAGAIHHQADIYLKNVGINPTRTASLQILQQMGANLTMENEEMAGREPVADLQIRSSILKPVNIGRDQIPNCIDELPILIIAMLFADGISRISGAEELRHKETDRLQAMKEILEKSGADFIEFRDGFEIHGDPEFKPKSGRFNSFHDHRIAMAAAVLSLMGEKESVVLDADCSDVSYPGFWEDVTKLTN